jgi:hypothetical protein
MKLKIVRGPLEDSTNEQILNGYNQLTSSQIPMWEFLHWVQEGPEGPAWHAILETDESEVVGHTALIPLRSRNGERGIVAGKAEYAFILEEYQTAKIRGFEKLGKPRNAIMIQELFSRWRAEGLGPLLISTSAVRQRSLSTVGCRAARFAVSECLLTLRPWNAARSTPNLSRWQRATLGMAGIFQKGAWSVVRLSGRAAKGIQVVPAVGDPWPAKSDGLGFFEDSDSLSWLYLDGQYERLASQDGEGVIVKKGSIDRYLRICQWRIGAGGPSFALISKLVEMAETEKALGVRWAVYGDGAAAGKLARRLGSFGFLCAQRARTLLIHSQDPELLRAGTWNLTDAMFSFDP